MVRIRNKLSICSPLGQLPLPPPPHPSEREDLSYFYLFSSFLFYFQTQFTPITSTSLGSVSPPSTGHLCLVSCQVKVFIGHWLTKSKSPFSVFEKTFHIPWTTSNSFLQAIFVRPQLMSKCVLQLSPANVSECLPRDSTQLFLAPIPHLRHPPESEIRKLFQFGFGSWWIDAQAYIGSHIHIHCALIRPYIYNKVRQYMLYCCWL